MLIMHQLTAVLALLFCSGFHGADAQCVHTLRRLARQDCPLKVAVQTANWGLNGHFLGSGCAVWLADWAKGLSPFLAHGE